MPIIRSLLLVQPPNNSRPRQPRLDPSRAPQDQLSEASKKGTKNPRCFVLNSVPWRAINMYNIYIYYEARWCLEVIERNGQFQRPMIQPAWNRLYHGPAEFWLKIKNTTSIPPYRPSLVKNVCTHNCGRRSNRGMKTNYSSQQSTAVTKLGSHKIKVGSGEKK